MESGGGPVVSLYVRRTGMHSVQQRILTATASLLWISNVSRSMALHNKVDGYLRVGWVAWLAAEVTAPLLPNRQRRPNAGATPPG